MDLREVTASAVGSAKDELRGLARFERILGGVLVATPALLIWVDTGPADIRKSISAYHDVSTPSAFYVPLTAAAMLFLVNGLVRDKHGYNTWLGVALSGVILFDHDGWTSVPHTVFAASFFLGNVGVMMFFSKGKSTALKVVFVGVIAAAGLLALLTQLSLLIDWFTLFWAEWVSLAIIAAHFILDSLDGTAYRALMPGEDPHLVPPARLADQTTGAGC